MATQFLKARQTKYAAYAAIYIVAIVAIVSTANILADRYNKSYDATANKRYSLSDQTVKIVKQLKQDATITYFDQPRGFAHAKDQLELYSNLSPKVHVKYVDADKDVMVTRAAGVKRPGTAIVQIGDKKEEAKSVTEEGITGAFIRDLKTTTRTVCFTTGSGEHQIDDANRDGYSQLRDLLGKDEYSTRSISLLQKAEVPGDCTVLVVGGPSGDYQQPQVEAIKKFVEEYHEKLEEDFLFPRFRKAGKLVSLVDTLQAQHKAGRELTAKIRELGGTATLKYVSSDSEKLSDALREFLRMYRPHEAREDTVLFPAFRKIVSHHEYEALGDDFEKKEDELFGEDGFFKVVDQVAQLEKKLGIYELAQFTPR